MKRVVLVLFAIFQFFSSYADRNDSLKAFLSDTFDFNNPTHYIKIVSKNIIEQDNIDLARYLIDEGIKKGKADKNDTLVTMMNYYLADYYFFKEDFRRSFELYQEVLPRFEEIKDTLMMAKTLNSFGLIYGYRNDIENTLKYYLKEIELLDQIKQRNEKIDREKIVVLTNIINHYRETKQYKKVIEQAVPAISFAREIDDSVRLASIMNSLGMAYKNLNQIDKSLETLRDAEKIFEALGDEFRKAYIHINIGGVFDYIHKEDSSLRYYDQALETFRNEGYVYGELNALTGIAGVYAVQRRNNDAREIFLTCVDTAKAYGFNDIVLESYAALARIEYETENYKKAYDFKELFSTLNDSIFSVEKDQQYAKLQTQYETVQKENEINMLKAEKLTSENELRRNKLLNWIAYTFTLILLVFIYVGYVFYNQKRKANALLTEKNNQIELKNIQLSQMNQKVVQINEKLQQSQIELTIANSAKNRFFSILGHDLRNPFHSIMGHSYLLSKSYDKLTIDERKRYANDILSSCEQLNRLLDNLLEWIRTQSEGITINPREFKFYPLVQESLSVLKNNALEKSIEINNTIDKDIRVTADYAMIETVLRNLINNGIKFTPNGGKISISATQKDNLLKVEIADNGVGIQPDDIQKLFNVDSNIKTRGTNNERGTGLGLVICKEFINLHKGEIWVESELGHGTVIHLSIPSLS